jgi:alpha-L-arabinofuranosidase
MRISHLVFSAFLFLQAMAAAATTTRAEAALAKKTAAVAVDAGQVGAPISKYVYGQFIEHLGRCIYGGIWAEILEDRKFYYSIGDRESPWKAMGNPLAVGMDTDRPFAGKHAPRLTLSGETSVGIRQEGLGLRKGMSYVGSIWLAGDSGAGPVSVRLVWGDGPADGATATIDKISSEYVQTALSFTAGADTDRARLEIAGRGKGTLRIGAISLMPGDNIQGMRADTLKILKELDAPVYRWPGGNFVSGYDWRDGIGERDRRPTRKNPAWKGIEPNDFGLDEFMTFCRYLGTDPYITVNSGLGDVEMAVAEVRYANGNADAAEGKLRATNGHPEPYLVKFWAIGNEMYGNWQLGHMPLDKYIEKHNRFAQAMRAADPTLSLIAVGEAGRWSEGMLRHCAERMDLISEHFYCHQKPNLLEHVQSIPHEVRRIADAHRRYRSEFANLKGKDIRIALDEWNYWYGEHLYGELGTRYFMKDALGVAEGLHELFRNSDLYFMANYAQTVNVIGAIKTSKTAAEIETTGLALALYRRHFGVWPLKTTVEKPLDAACALSADKKTLTLAVVNPTADAIHLPLSVQGVALTGEGKQRRIAGQPMDYNEPGKPRKVTIQEAEIKDAAALIADPYSITLYSLSLK